MERIENIGFGELKLIQEPDRFCYGIDAVILADFACSICLDFDCAVDLGTGNGIIPLILSHKNKVATITGIDVQRASIELAKRSCILNGLEARLTFIEADVTEELRGRYVADEADIVTCNPPYFPKGGAIPNKNSAKFIARHETTASVEDFIKAAALILKDHGHFFMVHRPSRLADIFYYCRLYGLEPKNMRLVVPRQTEAPNIVLIHCIKGGGKELKVMNELAVYDENGNYTDEIQRIYGRNLHI